MEENSDPKIVVIDRDMYDLLRGLAEIGAVERGDDLTALDRHIRRFNPALAVEAATVRREEEQHLRNLRKAAKDLLKRQIGKTVFYKVSERRFCPGILKGIEREGRHTVLRVLLVGAFDEARIHPSSVFEEVPAEAEICVKNPRTHGFEKLHSA